MLITGKHTLFQNNLKLNSFAMITQLTLSLLLFGCKDNSSDSSTTDSTQQSLYSAYIETNVQEKLGVQVNQFSEPIDANLTITCSPLVGGVRAGKMDASGQKKKESKKEAAPNLKSQHEQDLQTLNDDQLQMTQELVQNFRTAKQSLEMAHKTAKQTLENEHETAIQTQSQTHQQGLLYTSQNQQEARKKQQESDKNALKDLEDQQKKELNSLLDGQKKALVDLESKQKKDLDTFKDQQKQEMQALIQQNQDTQALMEELENAQNTLQQKLQSDLDSLQQQQQTALTTLQHQQYLALNQYVSPVANPISNALPGVANTQRGGNIVQNSGIQNTATNFLGTTTGSDTSPSPIRPATTGRTALSPTTTVVPPVSNLPTVINNTSKAVTTPTGTGPTAENIPTSVDMPPAVANNRAPVITPPVVVPPTVTENVSPVITPPVVAPPTVTESVSPVMTPPVVVPATVTENVSPVMTPPVVEPPTVTDNTPAILPQVPIARNSLRPSTVAPDVSNNPNSAKILPDATKNQAQEKVNQNNGNNQKFDVPQVDSVTQIVEPTPSVTTTTYSELPKLDITRVANYQGACIVTFQSIIYENISYPVMRNGTINANGAVQFVMGPNTIFSSVSVTATNLFPLSKITKGSVLSLVIEKKSFTSTNPVTDNSSAIGGTAETTSDTMSNSTGPSVTGNTGAGSSLPGTADLNNMGAMGPSQADQNQAIQNYLRGGGAGTSSNAPDSLSGVTSTSGNAITATHSAPLKTVVGAGDSFSCALVPNENPQQSAKVYCWGSDEYGVISNFKTGIKNNVSKEVADKSFVTPGLVERPLFPTPTLVENINQSDGNIVDLSVGDQFACVLTSNNSVWCWGYMGQTKMWNDDFLKQPSSESSNYGYVSSKVVWPGGGGGTPSGGKITSIIPGFESACALTASGSINQIWCWGFIDYTETPAYTATPILVSAGFSQPIKAVAIANNVDSDTNGGGTLCVIAGIDSHIECIGHNQFGQLGSNNSDPNAFAAIPVTVVKSRSIINSSANSVIKNVIDISAKNNTICALTGSRESYCWGSLNKIHFTDSDSNYKSYLFTNLHGNDPNYSTDPNTQTAAGFFTNAAIHPIKRDKKSKFSISLIQIGTFQGCGVDAANASQVLCWGVNALNNIKSESSDNQILTFNNFTGIAGEIKSFDSSIVSLAIGNNYFSGRRTTYGHGCAALVNGTVWCWGGNDSGQVGNVKTTENKSDLYFSALTSSQTFNDSHFGRYISIGQPVLVLAPSSYDTSEGVVKY